MLAFFVYLRKCPIMISISTVYNAVKALANDDQKGFVTPYSFNAMASIAQMNVYNEIMSSGFEGSRFTSSRSDVSGASSRLNSFKKHRDFYLEFEVLSNDGNGFFELPANANKVEECWLGDNITNVVSGSANKVPVSFDSKRAWHFNQPSTGRGIYSSNGTQGAALMNSSFFIRGKNGILTNQSTTADVVVSFYRSPGSITDSGLVQSAQPSLSFEVLPVLTLDGEVNEYVVQDDSSFNFDLPDVFLSDVVNEIAKLIGVQLEEAMVYQYGASEELGNEKKQLN